MHLNELKALHVSEVLKQAEELEIENTGRMRKQELMFAIIKKRARTGEQIIADGVLVSTKGRTTDQNSIYEAHAKGTWDVPLVLLTDGDSASASEIVAGAVRDHHRATIVGRKTYGKWSVQSILPGQADSGFRLTTAKFYAPNGETFGKIGIKPDITIPEDKTQAAAKRGRRKDSLDDDRDVEAGLEVLRKQLANR